MNTALSWIKAYVPELECTGQEYCDAMTLSGTKVEGYQRLDKNLEKIVVGQIEKIEKHPDADKLIVCQVNIGAEVIQIVTGAPNVKEGDKVPVVLDGGKVAGGHGGGALAGLVGAAASRLCLLGTVVDDLVQSFLYWQCQSLPSPVVKRLRTVYAQNLRKTILMYTDQNAVGNAVDKG